MAQQLKEFKVKPCSLSSVPEIPLKRRTGSCQSSSDLCIRAVAHGHEHGSTYTKKEKEFQNAPLKTPQGIFTVVDLFPGGLGIEPRAWCVLCKCSVAELHPQPTQNDSKLRGKVTASP